jgi:hypothetical protein
MRWERMNQRFESITKLHVTEPTPFWPHVVFREGNP